MKLLQTACEQFVLFSTLAVSLRHGHISKAKYNIIFPVNTENDLQLFVILVFVRYANVFLHPVTDDEAPGYHSIVFRLAQKLRVQPFSRFLFLAVF